MSHLEPTPFLEDVGGPSGVLPCDLAGMSIQNQRVPFLSRQTLNAVSAAEPLVKTRAHGEGLGVAWIAEDARDLVPISQLAGLQEKRLTPML